MTKKKRASESASDTNTDKDKTAATVTNSARAPTSASPSKNTDTTTQQPTATSELPRGKQSAAVDAVLKQMDEDEKNLVGKGVDKLPASWAQYENVPWMIADEGAVKKHTLVEGKGDTVPVMHRCYVNIIGRLSDDSVFLDYSHEELDFMTGHAQVPKGLEMAVVSMKVGERVLLRIAPSYGYSRTRKPENVPIDAYLYLDVTVVRFEKERNLHEMNTEEKIYYCIKRRELGKELFSASKPRSALKQYEKALTVLETSMQKCEDRYLKDKNEQLILNYVNVATCHFQVKDYSKSVEFCNKALRLDPDHVKALYRRAVCERLLADWEDSLRDYNKVIMTCTDMAIVTKCQADIKIVRTELAKAEAKTKAKLRGLFNHDAARGLYQDKSDEPKEQVLTKPDIPPTLQTPTVDWRAAAARSTPSNDPNQLGNQPSLLTRNDPPSSHGHAHGPGDDHGHAHGDGEECQHEERKGPCHAVTSWFRSTCSRNNKNKTE